MSERIYDLDIFAYNQIFLCRYYLYAFIPPKLIQHYEIKQH